MLLHYAYAIACFAFSLITTLSFRSLRSEKTFSEVKRRSLSEVKKTKKMSCSAVPAVCEKCKFGWYVTLDYLKAVHCTKCDGTAGSAPVPDAEKAGYFKEKKSKSERKREKQQARAAAIRQARARRAARAN